MTTIKKTRAASKEMSTLSHYGFQTLYLEYYAVVRNLDHLQTIKLLNQGLIGNLQQANFNPDNLRFLQVEIKQEADRIIQNKVLLESAYLAYQHALQMTHGDKGAADKNTAHTALVSWLASSKNTRTLKQLTERYEEEIRDNPDNYWLDFELGWIRLHLLSDAKAAYQHFVRAAEQCVADDTPLTELALRYVAASAFINADYTAAIAAIQSASSITAKANEHYQYEAARYYAAYKNTDKTVTLLRSLIKHSPVFYMQTQADPAFSECDQVDQLLIRFHTAKLEEIKQRAMQKWQSSPFYTSPLPKEFNKNEIYEQVVQNHVPLLQHQSYNALFKTDAIANKIVKNIENKSISALTEISDRYEQTIGAIKKRWKVVNIAGVGLLYLAVLLTLASIFLLIGSDFIGAALNTETESIDWGALIPMIFGGVLISAVVGVLLTRFDPPSLKSVVKARNQIMRVLEADLPGM